MGLFESLQKKSHREKVRIIWLVAGLTAAFLIVAWVFASRYYKDTPKDVSVFQVISRGFNDISSSLRKK